MIYKNADAITASFHITKEAEDTIYHFAQQADCEFDEALELILGYAGVNFLEILKSLDIDFNPDKLA